MVELITCCLGLTHSETGRHTSFSSIVFGLTELLLIAVNFLLELVYSLILLRHLAVRCQLVMSETRGKVRSKNLIRWNTDTTASCALILHVGSLQKH